MGDLNKYKLFFNIDKEQNKYINKLFNKIEFATDKNIFLEGEDSTEIYFIEKGEVIIYRVTEKGNEKIFKIMRDGELFGEMGVIDDKKRSASARTRSKSTLLILDKDDYLNILKKYNNIALNNIKILTERLRNADREIQLLSFTKTKNRLIKLLQNLSYKKNNQFFLDNNLTHQEIAAIIGTTRETVTRLINELEGEGLIDRTKNKIILKKDLLR